MTNILKSVVANALTDTTIVDVLNAPGSNVSLLLREIEVTNLSGTATALDLLANNGYLYQLPAPAADGMNRTFDPGLLLPENSKLSLRSRDSAEIIAALSYQIQSARGGSPALQPTVEDIIAAAFTPKDPTSSGVKFGQFDGVDDRVNWVSGTGFERTAYEPFTHAFTFKATAFTDLRGGASSGKIWSSQISKHHDLEFLDVGLYSRYRLIIQFKDGAGVMAYSYPEWPYSVFNSGVNTLLVTYDGSGEGTGFEATWNGDSPTHNGGEGKTGTLATVRNNHSSWISNTEGGMDMDMYEMAIWTSVLGGTDIAARHTHSGMSVAPDYRHVLFDDTSGTAVTEEIVGNNGILSGDDGSTFWQANA